MVTAAQAELAARRLKQLREGGEPLPVIRSQWPETVLDDFQQDIIRSFFTPSVTEIFIKGCAKAGKGCAVAIAINLWFLAHPQSKIILTSQRFQHAMEVIFAEVAAWRQRMQFPGPGELRRAGITHHEQHYVTIANPDTGEGFSGQHGPHSLFVFDEATSVPDEFYDLAKTQAKLIVALANPRTLSGWFRRAFPLDSPNKTQTIETPFGKRRCITISGRDCRNVCEGHEVIPNQLAHERFEALMSHPDPRWRSIFALGEFPEEDPECQVILASWLDRHEAAWHPGITVEAFGLDVAASEHGDHTVLTAGGRDGVKEIHKRQKADTMETIGWFLSLARDRYGIDLPQQSVPVTVDMDGLGKGVGDRLQEQGVWIIEFRGNATSSVDSRTYANLRAEAYGELGRRLNPVGPWSDKPWAIPPDPQLREELVAPEKTYASDGLCFRLTPKRKYAGMSFRGETLQEKLGRSPDTADAVVYLHHSVRTLESYDAWNVRHAGELICSSEDPRDDELTAEDWENMPQEFKETFTMCDELALKYGRDRDDYD